MLQDSQAIRYYQKLTDGMVDLWNRGRRFDEIQSYMDGYLACLRHTSTLEIYLINRLEEEVWRFFRDPSNFEMTRLQTEPDYY
ncbi:DUF6761 family protein [Aphanothece sacrum]|uniref:Uncharacterized protein n=1 Tax=Aphanothece sacrum FPU1 TaxID=1920663 RepID=A0A401IC90_APHSA|nr:DUF6761 family protein [Aphanothece sacrum]GBF78840.1 hypothetical protein AsFPU1_0230 [Aphanothece sacrum FPU1]GBF83072.1 hypothetical protein AsFPU3_0110 [Aphanothece sacrum FPU3]